MIHVPVSSVGAKETAAFVSVAKMSDTDVVADLCAELESGAKITLAISEAMRDGKISPEEAQNMLEIIELRRDSEEELMLALNAIAMKGKDHG